MQSYDSVIFDLDGTLWDTVEQVCVIWNKALIKAGFEPIVDYAKLSSCMGMLIDDIIKKLLPQATEPQIAQIKENCLQSEQKYLAENGGILYDGIEDTLEKLSEKYKLFIVSNCQDGYIQSFFKAHGLEKYFIDYECAGRTGLTKGENIRLVIDKYGLKSPVYVGDTMSDKTAANSAGVPFVFAEYGFGEVDSFDYKINCLSDLLKIL